MKRERLQISATTSIITANVIIDPLIETWRSALGSDHDGYRNHVYRVFNLAVAMAEATEDGREKLAIAAAFHDIGIWLDGTFDYLQPSSQRATEYLERTGRSEWSDTVHEIIDQHHRIRSWHGSDQPLVEAFRKADWLDVCLFALPSVFERAYFASILHQFPRCGFHRRLIAITLHWTRTHPLNPLPIVRW